MCSVAHPHALFDGWIVLESAAGVCNSFLNISFYPADCIVYNHDISYSLSDYKHYLSIDYYPGGAHQSANSPSELGFSSDRVLLLLSEVDPT